MRRGRRVRLGRPQRCWSWCSSFFSAQLGLFGFGGLGMLIALRRPGPRRLHADPRLRLRRAAASPHGLPERESWRAAFAHDRQPGLDLHQPAAHPGLSSATTDRTSTTARGSTRPRELAVRGRSCVGVRQCPRAGDSVGPDGSSRRPVRLACSSASRGPRPRSAGRRRRCRSSTQQAAHAAPARRRPRCRRARCRASLTASTAARATGSTPSPRQRLGLGLVVAGRGRRRPASRAAGPRPAARSPRPRGGTGRDRTAAPGRRRTPGPRIEPSETVRPPSSITAIVWAAASRRDQARATWLERRGDRLDRAEVGTGADDDLDAGLPQRAYALGEVRTELPTAS